MKNNLFLIILKDLCNKTILLIIYFIFISVLILNTNLKVKKLNNIKKELIDKNFNLIINFNKLKTKKSILLNRNRIEKISINILNMNYINNNNIKILK
ncbi:cell division protein FtsL [endosymbiont of Sipalinus gigas]|uniref:cell division protein FtsL n=1 Tax=endosymbiont of Sipalinus gigas TaxID=1972134 RepID=UPI000DC71314|nr:cell division protein FtsL [endosymbiont of Sipalinus gigas]BBA85171.1 cell division protein FtsL [endosymbiont of Sipalinus gigas]